MDFIEELRWRGMLNNLTAGTEELFRSGSVSGYIGFDPTSDSLHIGNLMQIQLLRHFQIAGHKPIVLVGGATGMIGDPSGKTEERNLLSESEIRHNEKCIGIQLRKLLDFDCGRKSAEMVNNFDWFINISTLAFLRDVGKHITINYLLAKGFIKERLEKELSFTEFNYILMQAYDFLYLWQNKNCKLQMGGSDQWGNITTGIELIRKKCGGDAFGITSPLLLKPDGTKFGKTESGNIWLDPAKTSPYKFFQFWLNISDEEAGRCIRIFTFLPKDQIASLEKEHSIAPEGRILQKTIAKILTAQVHSEEACRKATGAGEILFGSGHVEALKNYSSVEIDEIFEGVPRFSLSKTAIESGMGIIDFTCVHTSVFPSKSEARRMIGNGGLSINKTKVVDETLRISTNHLIAGRYILVQKGKKNFFLISAE